MEWRGNSEGPNRKEDRQIDDDDDDDDRWRREEEEKKIQGMEVKGEIDSWGESSETARDYTFMVSVVARLTRF